MYFSNVTFQGLPTDYYVLDLEFGSTKAQDSEQDVPLEIAITQYHLGQQKHKQFLKYCYDSKYDDHTILRGLKHSNLPFEKYSQEGRFDVIINEFLDYFDPSLPIGGWNVKGDLKVLNYYINYHRNNNKLLNTRVNYFNIDYYIKLLGGLDGLKLEQAGRLYGYDTSKMHHAINDVRLTHRIYEKVRAIYNENPETHALFERNKLDNVDLRQSVQLVNETTNNHLIVPINKPNSNNNVIAGKLYEAQQKQLAKQPTVTVKELNKHTLNNEPPVRIRSKKKLNYTFIGTSECNLAVQKKDIMSSLAKQLNKTLICHDNLKQIDFVVYIDDIEHWQKLNKENLLTPKETEALDKKLPVLSLQDLKELSQLEDAANNA